LLERRGSYDVADPLGISKRYVSFYDAFLRSFNGGFAIETPQWLKFTSLPFGL
jgi:hypothetical protein